MAMNSLSPSKFRSMRWEERLNHYASEIMLKGFGRPWQLYGAHIAIFAANYGGFFAFISRDLLKLFRQRRCAGGAGEEDQEEAAKERRSLASLLYVKFLVWQHLAEAIGCRQGPIGGHYGLPNNWRYRLSLGTIKCPLIPFLGKTRNIVDLIVHVLFFAAGTAFLTAKEYKLKYIRALAACDVWICLSDLSQFFASTGHAYFSMLLSACFPENRGRLAGIQTALIMQWFFSGVGKIGPWFSYVNGPFMLQSKFLEGQRWLFDFLVKSTTDLSPTTLGSIVAHSAAAVEYIAPLALMWPKRARPSLPSSAATTTSEGSTSESTTPSPEKTEKSALAKRDLLSEASIWFGLAGLVGMHTYILSMPAPFDVYSWNACFGLSAIYLFYCANFGFDHPGASKMHPGLAAWLMGEFALCWYGQFFPDQIGYYLSHRYWAGNWVQTGFYVKNTPEVLAKLGRVKYFAATPFWRSLMDKGAEVGTSNLAYLWLANLNMKSFVGLTEEAARVAGGAGAKLSDFIPIGLTQLCTGEFRDALYTLNILPTIQEKIGFDAGECFMVRLGAFGMFQETATWGIYDLKDGLLKNGLLSISKLAQIHSFPSQSLAVTW